MSKSREVDTVAGAVVYSHFEDPFANGPDISGIARRQPFYSDLHSCSCSQITQAIKPKREGLGLSEFYHGIL